MREKTTRVISSSQVSLDPLPHTRNERLYTLTPLGHQAVRWLEQQDEKPLPMDRLPHREIKKS